MTNSTNLFDRKSRLSRAVDSNSRLAHLPMPISAPYACRRKFILGLCACAALVSSAVPLPSVAQTTPEPVKSIDSPKPSSETAAAPAASPAHAPATQGTATQATPTAGSGKSVSLSTADDFIPGSEVLPAPEKTTAQHEEFVKSQKPTMDLAMVLYKNNEFKQSLSVLQKLPQNEQVHYYISICLS